MSKRGVIKQKIQTYYVQLTEGCGKESCPNENCASNSSFLKLASDKAALKAIELYKNKSTQCLNNQDDVNSVMEVTNASSDANNAMECTTSSSFLKSNCSNNNENKLNKDKKSDTDLKVDSNLQAETTSDDSSNILDETQHSTKCKKHFRKEILQQWINEDNDDLEEIKQILSELFSDCTTLNEFSMPENTDMEVDEKTLVENTIDELKSPNANKKETTLKVQSNQTIINIDMIKIRNLLNKCKQHDDIEEIILNATKVLLNKEKHNNEHVRYLNVYVITMENYSLQSPSALDLTFPLFCEILANLDVSEKSRLARYWSGLDASIMKDIVENLQQLITFKIVINMDNKKPIHEIPAIVSATQCLCILYHACLLGGTVNKEIDESGAAASKLVQAQYNIISDNQYNFAIIDETENNTIGYLIGKELEINNLDSSKPLVSLDSFINEELNKVVEVDKDYANYRTQYGSSSNFSLFNYPFILTTVNKTAYFFYNSRVRMYSEQRRTLVSSLIQGSLLNPYLKIQVRRTHIIDDTLIQLELAAENIRDFKKQLYVEFDGEEGVDEGGVSKEFFQLVIENIFNPENGMFIYNSDTRLFDFNPHSFEGGLQYRLIGIVLGLAIYNNCILDISFPSYVYKKLLGRKATFKDMQQSRPVLYNSLKSMLNHEENVEEDFMSTFQIQYEDVFGTKLTHDLKENGDNITVTNENCGEFVNLYADWLLNKSIQDQFNAFRSGFDIVVNESPLKHLFYPQELELLIIGSENYDFDELENTTSYDGGFSKSSQTVKDFWSVVHEFTMEEKRKLLQFSTGSDRAPVGGLSKLKMIIARNGPDSNRLPTAHTCFNVILLPDYKNLEKLKERLHKAIIYSKGFGML